MFVQTITPSGYSMSSRQHSLTPFAVRRKSSTPKRLRGSPTSPWLPSRSLSTENGATLWPRSSFTCGSSGSADRCGCIQGVQAATVQASLMKPEDVAIMIVHSGDDPVARQILRRAASVGAHTVLVTETANTPLGREAEIKLQTCSTTSDAVLPLFGTRPGQLLVMGYLWLLAAQRMPETAAEATAFIGKR